MSENQYDKSTKKEVSVFVTSKYLDRHTNTNKKGKRFVLNDYPTQEVFIREVLEYVTDVLGDDKPELCFMDVESDLCVDVFIDHEGRISGELWKMLALNDDDLSLLNAYLSYHALHNYDVLNNNVEKALTKAKQSYIGYFPAGKINDLDTDTIINSYNHQCHYFRKQK